MEILIVIMIIGVLSVLAINGYSSYRRASLVNLNADNLVAQIMEQQGNADRGDFDSDRADAIKDTLSAGETVLAEGDSDAKCFGVSFENTADGFVAKSLKWDFESDRVYDAGELVYVGCDKTTVQSADVEIDDQVFISSVTYSGFSGNEQTVNSELALQFQPPAGELVVYDDSFEIEGVYSVKILMQYGGGNDPRYQREIIFNLNSLTATVNEIQ